MRQHEKSVRKYINLRETIAIISMSLFIGTLVTIKIDFGQYIHGFKNIFPIIVTILVMSLICGLLLALLIILALRHYLDPKDINDIYHESYEDCRKDLRDVIDGKESMADFKLNYWKGSSEKSFEK